MHKCIIAFRWKIQEVKCFIEILAPASALVQHVAGKHCIVGDTASSDTLILNDSFH